MRKSYLFLAAAALFSTTIISSCSKTDSADALPTNYRIDGVQDVKITAPYYSAYEQLSVNYVGKTQEKVTLSLSGAPTGCGMILSATSGYPSFNSTLSINDTAAAPGTYPIKLTCEGSVTGKRSYTFNLTLPDLPQCTDFLLGTHSAYSTCSSSGSYTEYVTASGTRNRVILNNFGGMGIQLALEANCQSSSYTIPQQTINGITYSGYGYYSSSSYFYVYVTESSPIGTSTCTEYIYL
ncbi:hypothetical protein ACTHGU_01310 [Chitinophagaceae bacterium MMS25-I14]